MLASVSELVGASNYLVYVLFFGVEEKTGKSGRMGPGGFPGDDGQSLLIQAPQAVPETHTRLSIRPSHQQQKRETHTRDLLPPSPLLP